MIKTPKILLVTLGLKPGICLYNFPVSTLSSGLPRPISPSFTADDDNLWLGICLESAGVQCPGHVPFPAPFTASPYSLVGQHEEHQRPWCSALTEKSLVYQCSPQQKSKPQPQGRNGTFPLPNTVHSPSLILCHVHPAQVLWYPISISPFPPLAIIHRYHSLSLWTTPYYEISIKYP